MTKVANFAEKDIISLDYVNTNLYCITTTCGKRYDCRAVVDAEQDEDPIKAVLANQHDWEDVTDQLAFDALWAKIKASTNNFEVRFDTFWGKNEHKTLNISEALSEFIAIQILY